MILEKIVQEMTVHPFVHSAVSQEFKVQIPVQKILTTDYVKEALAGE